MQKIYEKIKKEFIVIFLLFILSIIIFKILFYKENILIILRAVASVFWMFVLPGFSLMYYWEEKLDFIERLIIGIILSAAIFSVIGYNLAFFGFHIKYHVVVIPVLCLAVGFFIARKKLSPELPDKEGHNQQ